jgi:hypothetical protein
VVRDKSAPILQEEIIDGVSGVLRRFVLRQRCSRAEREALAVPWSHLSHDDVSGRRYAC